MKLGLLTDIHEATSVLRSALACFRSEGVDQVVVIGDVFQTGQLLDETCELLIGADAIGVWGNHDYPICKDVAGSQARFSLRSARFMKSLQPSLTIGECHFAHVEPWLDPLDPADLWYFTDHRPASRSYVGSSITCRNGCALPAITTLGCWQLRNASRTG